MKYIIGPMGNCSTLFYIVDNTNKANETDLYPFEDFLTKTDQFLSSFFKQEELKVDDKVVNRILDACR